MRNRYLKTWIVSSIVVPFASGLAWLAFGHLLPGACGLIVGIVNAGLQLRRRIPLRVPSFVPEDKRTPVVVGKLRYPGNG